MKHEQWFCADEGKN